MPLRQDTPIAFSNTRSQRILLIRPTALGDVARSVPALVTLAKALPEAKIDWLVSQAYMDLIQAHPSLHQAIPFARKQLGKMLWNPKAAQEGLAMARLLRHNRYDLVIDLQGLLRSGVLARLTGAPQRVGFADAREGAWLMYNRRFTIDKRLHTVDRMLGLLQAAGFPKVEDMRLYPPAPSLAWVEAWLEQSGHTDRPMVCIAPTSQWLSKCWPLERYEQVIAQLLKKLIPEALVVVLAAPHERAYIQPMLDQFAGCPQVVAPSLSIGQVMAMMSRACLVVSNDSGPLHLAVGLGRPVVALYGPTDPQLVGPYRQLDAVVLPPYPVDITKQRYYRHHRDDQSMMADIPFEAVWAKVEERVDKRG